MLIFNLILLILTTVFVNKVYGYYLPACTESIHGRYPYAKSCTKYFECNNGQVTVFSCRPGLAYNSILGECDLPLNVKGCEYIQAQVNTVIVCPRDFIGQVADPKNCEQFTKCSRGFAEFMICAPGSVYNIENGYCDRRENVPGCFGDQGNGVNFRGDISISPQNPTNFREPYQGYHRQAPCRTPGCLPVNQQAPGFKPPSLLGSLTPSKPAEPFRGSRSQGIKEIPEPLNEADSENISEQIKREVIKADNSLDEATNSNRTGEPVSTVVSYDDPQITTNEGIKASNSNVEVTTKNGNDQDITTTGFHDAEEANLDTVTSSDIYKETEMTTENSSNRVSIEFEALTEASKEANSENSEKVKNELMNSHNGLDEAVDSDYNQKFDDVIDSVKGAIKNFSEQTGQFISDNVTSEAMEASGRSADASENKAKSFNKNEELLGKDPVLPLTNPDLHEPYFITMNGKKYYYIYKEVQIDQNHSRIRAYNQAPLVVNVKKALNITSDIKKKSVDLRNVDDESIRAEPPFPFHYTAPIYHRSMRDVPKLTPLSGQSVRLRGEFDLNHGYVEVQGDKPGWGVVCHTEANWTLKEADIICRQLGYSKGAQMVWKGRVNENEIYPWVATSYVQCLGNETWFQTCKFRNNSECKIQRDSVGIRCHENNEVHCHEDEVFHDGFCYHLAELDSSLNHREAEQRCNTRNSSLLYITKQRENDFLSEWLIRKHPNVESVMMGGTGFPSNYRSKWLWKNAQKTNFSFSKWWPGWNNEKVLPPLVESSPLCIIMKKEFPCDDENQTVCHTDYFFWNAEDCLTSKEKSYICKRPQD